MTTKARRGGLASLVFALGLALFVAALPPFPLAAQSQTFTLPPAEKVPTFLGIDLPLRSGERLLPIGDEGCAAVVYAPRPARYESARKSWEGAEWIGACRFGLAHGKGYAYHAETNAYSEVYMLYGTLIEPPEKLSQIAIDGGGTGDRQTQYFYAGPSFSDLSTRSLISYAFDYWEDTVSLDIVAKYWGWDSFIYAYRFNETGDELMSFYGELDVGPYCSGSLPAALSDFLSGHEKEVKKACAKKDVGKHVLLRRDGFSSQRYDQAPVVWLKSCPIDKVHRTNDCGKLLEEAAGRDLAAINGVLADSKAMRAVAEAEILARFAPLERALQARVSSGSPSSVPNAGGGQ